MPRGRRRAPPNQNVHYKILGTRKKGERSSLFRVLARTPFNSSVLLPFFPTLTLPPPRCGRLQARRRTELLPAGSTCHIDLRAALFPFRRALTRARYAYGGAALGLPSRACSCPCSDQPMAPECARVLCRAWDSTKRSPCVAAARRSVAHRFASGGRVTAGPTRGLTAGEVRDKRYAATWHFAQRPVATRIDVAYDEIDLRYRLSCVSDRTARPPPPRALPFLRRLQYPISVPAVYRIT